MNYYNSEILNDKIHIDFKDINNKDINTKIYSLLKSKVENKCYKSGFILKNSVKPINKSLGKLVNLDSNNLLEYKIKYMVKIIKPTIDDIIECYISEKNKLGILAYIKYKDIIDNGENNGISDSPLLIIIPNETIQNPERYNIGSKIRISVLATRSKINSDKVQVIGIITD